MHLYDGTEMREYFVLYNGDAGGSTFTGFSSELLNDVAEYGAHGSLTFAAFTTHYNNKHGCGEGRGGLRRDDLSEHFMAWTAIKYVQVLRLLDMDLTGLFSRSGRRDSMEPILLKLLPLLSAAFSRYWGSHAVRDANRPLIDARITPGDGLPTAATSVLARGDVGRADGVAVLQTWLDALFSASESSAAPGTAPASGAFEAAAAVHAVETDEYTMAPPLPDPTPLGCGHWLCSRLLIADGHMKW